MCCVATRLVSDSAIRNPKSQIRRLFPWLALALCLYAIGWAALRGSLPPADYTFNNATEVKSLDPAIVTGVPEHRIINALFEGLTRQHPQTLEAIPGVAERWGISDDGTVYTFHLRPDARWSDGSPVTANDFHYSLRRFLDPLTLAEYAYQAWYIKNARRYGQGASGIEPGDRVEVELPLSTKERNSAVRNTWRGKLLQGKYKFSISLEAGVVYHVVEIDGQPRRFLIGDNAAEASRQNCEPCRQILLDFREVGVQVVDERTLKITLENPTSYFLQLMAFYPMFPVNRSCVEKFGSPQWTQPGNLVSNGPFGLQFRRIRDRIRMRRSETYWNREKVKLHVVDALAIESPTTALNLFMTGGVDCISEAPPAALREMLQQQPSRNDLNPAPFLSIYFYRLNTTRKPLDDVRVRRALALALNRHEITRAATGAGEIPARSLVPPGIAGYRAQLCDEENRPLAQKLLAEAGYTDGKGFPRFSILYNTHESHQAIAELIRKQWQRGLSITVQTRNEEWASYLASQRQKQYDIVRAAWVGDYPDPNTFLDMFVTGGEQNNTGWGDPQYDRLIDEARRELDPKLRFLLLEKAERILMGQLPIIPIYYYVSKNLVKPHVRGFYNNLQDFHPLSEIWIDHDAAGPNEFMQAKPQANN